MPTDGHPLMIYVPIHVNDGLAITNFPSLYHWFLTTLQQNLLIINLGECFKFLSIVIVHDHICCRLWLFSHVYVTELLNEWNLVNVKHPNTPFPHKITEQLSLPPNVLHEISDDELTSKYHHLVGSLMYLTMITWPDIAYYAMWLG